MDKLDLIIGLSIIVGVSSICRVIEIITQNRLINGYKEYIKELEKSIKIYEDYVDNNEGN